MRRIILLFLILVTACVPVTPLATPTATPTAPPTLAPSPTPTHGFSVTLHPDGPLHVGDQVSLAISAPPGFNTADQLVSVSFNGNELGATGFGAFINGGRPEARLWWVWDTRELEAGPHTLTFTLRPAGTMWRQTVSLLPASDLPLNEQNQHWETFTTDCCEIHYINDTAAARDLTMLAATSDQHAEEIAARLNATAITNKIGVVFFPRVLGHGGFASDAIYVSYLDRNYAGGATAQVLHHELTHWYDAQLGGEFRPTILVEGLAVYISGGHFKVEPIVERAAAALELDLYIPLQQLTDDFYPQQHEIGYLEGAALIQYLVETYGWDDFNTFYRDIKSPADGLQSSALNEALQRHFALSFAQLEEHFKDYLRQQTVTAAHRQDVQLTVAFYDTVRRYQQLLDPSAYYLNAWLPDGQAMRERGIVADFTRHPESPVNIGLETLFVQADEALRRGDLTAAAELIKSINVMLDIVENR